MQGLGILLVGASLIHCSDSKSDEEGLKRERDNLATQNAALHNQLEAERTANEANEKQLQVLTQNPLALNDLETQISTLKNDTASKQAKIDAEAAEIEALKASGDALSADKIKLLEEQKKADEVALAAQGALLARLEDAKHLKAELEAALASEDAVVQARIRDLEEQVKVSEAAIAEQKNVVASLKTYAEDLKNLFKGSITPYAGIWLLDPKPELAFPDCQYMVRFDADQGSVYRALICSDGKIQAERQNVSSFSVDNSAGWSGSLGFKMITRSVKSSCGDQAGVLGTDLTYGFDHSVGTASATNEASLFMKTNIGTAAKSFKSGSSIPDLGKNKSCSTIITRSRLASQASNLLLQEAAKVCQLTPELTGTGCFTAADQFEPSL